MLSQTPMLKVTAFCIRDGRLLVFDHPAAGTQVPAGTVEIGEDPREAALRELIEETGVDRPFVVTTLGVIERDLRRGEAYALRDLITDDGRMVRRGLPIAIHEDAAGVRFVFEDWDYEQRPPILLDRREGVCAEAAVSSRVRRHFFIVATDDPRSDSWVCEADGWAWTVRWAAIDETLHLSGEQHEWLSLLPVGA